jgi:DNA-binding transcriptional ArsR family regulator
MNTRDRRSRQTFWIDDRVVDDFAPVMGRYSFGATALAVYAVLARRADREGDSWPSLGLIADESGASQRTVHKALRLLEVLGLVEVTLCYEQGSNRQTSNLYTLLTPPDPLPEIDPDPQKWPPPNRRTLLVRSGSRAESVAAARLKQSTLPGERRSWARLVPPSESETPRTTCTLSSASHAPSPRTTCTLSPARHAPLIEGNTGEGNTRKEKFFERKKDVTSFLIEEIGLTNWQVWAATLGEIARRGDVTRSDVETWLRPAALVGREGETLLLGAPNAVSRDRIATRLLPAVRDALGATIGAPVGVAVVVRDG